MDENIKGYKASFESLPREEKVRETILRSVEAFAQAEENLPLGHLDFLAGQFHLIRKRWWLLQILLLAATGVALPYLESQIAMVRTLGVAGVLFVVLIIPEFWKNKSWDCMQVEASCFYSLRQIYAARLVLFGVVDVALLTFFLVVLRGCFRLAFGEVLVQFLFPTAVAACICFGTLCSRRAGSEWSAIVGCLMWSALWGLLVLHETVYTAITVPVWCGLSAMAVLALVWSVWKTLRDCNAYWEVNLHGTAND